MPPIGRDMTENKSQNAQKEELERNLGLGMVIAIGMGGCIGASLFSVIGFAAGMAGPALPLALLLGGGLTLLISLNYSELSSAFPESGGGYTFSKKAYGGLPSFLTGWFMAFANIVFGSLSALAFAEIIRYIGLYTRVPTPPVIPIALLVIGIFTYLNTRGMEESGKAQVFLVLILVIGLFAFIGLSYPAVESVNFHPFMPRGWGGIMKATAFVYVAYFGFETIATVSGEVENPSKNLASGTILTVIAVTVIYILIGWIAVGVVNWGTLGKSASPLMLVGKKALPGDTGIIIIGILGGIATLSSSNTAIVASTRIIYALSRDGLLPESLSQLGEHKTPIYATLTAAVIMMLFAATGFIDFIAHTADFNLLLALMLVNLSVYFLRKKRGSLKRPFKSHRFLGIIGAGLCLVLIPFLDLLAISLGIAILIVGLLIYLFKLWHHKVYSITLAGISIGAGFILLSTLWMVNWSITVKGILLPLGNLLIVGCIIEFLVGIISAVPLGYLMIPKEGEVVRSPSQRKVRLITVVKNILSLTSIAFAVISLSVFYGIFYEKISLPGISTFLKAYKALLSLSLVSFAFSATVSGIFLYQRSYF